MIERSASPSSRRLGVALAITIATVAPAGAQSLWTLNGGSLVSDPRALRAGDLLTIVVDEQSSGEKTGETKLKRDSAFNGQVDMPRVTYPKFLNDLRFSLSTSGSGSSNFDGNGSTTRTD